MNRETHIAMLIDYLHAVKDANDYDRYNRACDKLEELLDIRRPQLAITLEKENGTTIHVGTISEAALRVAREE